MKTSDFNYDLPKELIAQVPLEDRAASRLMVLDKNTGEIKHEIFRNITDYLHKGDCLVINDTKVLPARLIGERKNTGAHVQILLLTRKDIDTWEVLVYPGKKAKIGDKVVFGGGKLEAEITGIVEGGNRIVKFSYEGVFENILDELGEMPLPPYITHKLENKEMYQTVYAKNDGSAAAPALIVPVHHDALAARINGVVVHVGRHIHRAARAARHLRPLRGQPLVVHKGEAEKVRAVLNVHYARLPEQHQQVHAAYNDIASAVPLALIPENALHARTLLELVPPCVAVHLFILAFIQKRGQDGRKLARRFRVVRRAGQNAGLRVVVQRIGMFVGDGIEQPARGRLCLFVHQPVLILLPVRHLEPQFVVHDAPVERGLASAVSLQDIRRAGDFLPPDSGLEPFLRSLFPHRFLCGAVFFIFHGCFLFLKPGRTAPGRQAPAGRPSAAAKRALHAAKAGFPSARTGIRHRCDPPVGNPHPPHLPYRIQGSVSYVKSACRC